MNGDSLGSRSAWLHWPLAFITRSLRYADDADEVRMRLWSDPREWLRRILMVFSLAGALIATSPASDRLKDVFPNGVASLIEYAFLIDVSSLFSQPWRVAALVGALITLGLSWYGLELRLLVARSAVRPDREVRAKKWAATLEYAMRVRDVCGWVFWALVLIHAGLWLTPSTEWLEGYPREILQTIYGDFLPPNLRR
jgi:hypothetical protein